MATPEGILPIPKGSKTNREAANALGMGKVVIPNCISTLSRVQRDNKLYSSWWLSFYKEETIFWNGKPFRSTGIGS